MPDLRAPDAAPLTGRAPGEILFLRGAEPVTVARYLADVAALAGRLPAGPAHALNLCCDRYRALVGFGAALSRGHVTLLSPDRSEHRQRELADRFRGTYALLDPERADHPPAGPLPAVPVEAAGRDGAAAPAPMIPLGRIAAVGFTSGSTGEPTAHRKPWGALVAAARAAGERFGLDQADDPATVVATVPPQHMYGFETTMLLPLHARAAGHAGPDFYPVEVAEALRAAVGRRVLVTTPLHLRALLGSAEPLPALDCVISATAPLAASLASEAERAWRTRVLEIYGATEVGSIASRRTVEGDRWLPYRGVALRRGEGEEVAVSAPGLPAPVSLADAVAIDADGGFRLLGRRSDVVKLGGKRASLAGLNRLLASLDGVQDGVFVAPEDLDRNPAARLTAYVVAPGLSRGDILAALRGRIEPAFLPRPVVMLPALPRDAVGKLSRRALAELQPCPAD